MKYINLSKKNFILINYKWKSNFKMKWMNSQTFKKKCKNQKNNQKVKTNLRRVIHNQKQKIYKQMSF